MFAFVEYLHVADSFVDSERVVCVVPAVNVPVGDPLLRVGGVVSCWISVVGPMISLPVT